MISEWSFCLNVNSTHLEIQVAHNTHGIESANLNQLYRTFSCVNSVSISQELSLKQEDGNLNYSVSVATEIESKFTCT